MVSFVSPFTSQPPQPSQVSYAAYTFATSMTLVWPAGLMNTSSPAALAIDLNATAAGLYVQLPDATQVSVGRAILFAVTGPNSVEIRASNGSSITTIAAGVQKYVMLIDNSTAVGSWRITTFGAGTSGADAIALAGAGLQAAANLLNWAPSTLILNGSTTLSVGNRATAVVWQGGAGTITLPLAASATDRWIASVTNNGSGTVAVDGNGSLIDGSSSLSMLPGESSMFINVGGTQWNKIGYGRSIAFTVTTLAKAVPSAGTPYTLSVTEAAAQIQRFTGLLAANIEIRYGSAPNFYFVENATTGAFTTTFKGLAADPGVVVAQGTRAILVNTNGTMTLAVSLTSGTVTNIATGPGLTGGPITSTGTLDIAASAVTPGTYGSATTIPQFTVDGYGRITAASAISPSPGRLVGESVAWNGIDLPAGYLWEDGTAYNRVTYALLLTAITSVSTGTPANGSPTLTAVAKDYRNLGVEGAKIEGINIPAGTTVVSVTVNTIVMSANANGSPGSVAIRLLPHGNGDGATTFNVPDARGRVGAARDNQGGSTAGRLTSGVSGVIGSQLGGAGGDQRRAAHIHTASAISNSTSGFASGGTPFTNAGSGVSAAGGLGMGIDLSFSITTLTSVTVNSDGAGISENVQPTLIRNSIIYAGI